MDPNMSAKEKPSNEVTLRPGDAKAEVSMGFVCRGSIADFTKIRAFIETFKNVRLVRGTMSESRLWLVKDREFKLLQSTIREVESRGGGDQHHE